MKPKVKEPFFIIRAVNFLLGIAILALIIAVLVLKRNTEIFHMLIFVLAAVMNFIAATVNFSEQKKLRGNIYAVICALFLIVAIVMILGFIGII